MDSGVISIINNIFSLLTIQLKAHSWDADGNDSHPACLSHAMIG